MPADAPLAAFLEPSTRTWVDWDPGRIKTAELLADAGNLRMAAELCDALLADDRVQGCLTVRARGLLVLPRSFEDGAGRQRRRDQARRYLEAEEDFDAAYPEHELARLNGWGILLGVGLAQQVWGARPNGRVVGALDPWHPRALRYDEAARVWRVRTDGDGEVDVVAGDPRWILYTPGGAKRPWTHGAWRAVARWWLLKHYAQSDWGKQGERAAGVIVATPPAPGTPGVTVDEGVRRTNRDRLVADLKSLAKNAALALPPGWDLDIVQSEASAWKTYEAQIEIANAGIAIALNGQNLTSEVKSGSLAAAEVHKAVANVLLASDGGTLPTALHDQALVHWARFNLGDERAAPWPFWDTTPPLDLAQLATTWQASAAAVEAWRKLGIDPDVDEIARRVGMPVRAPAEGERR